VASIPTTVTPDSPWRKLGCFKQALLVLAHLRKNETFAQVAAGFGVSQATAWRYLDETVEALAAWAPGLHGALVGLGEDDFVIVDGALVPTDRIGVDEVCHSQEHKQHGMNVQVIAAPDGTPLWFSRATPGRTHDLTAARAHGIIQVCLTRQILILADRAYQGAGATDRTPYYGHRELPQHYQRRPGRSCPPTTRRGCGLRPVRTGWPAGLSRPRRRGRLSGGRPTGRKRPDRRRPAHTAASQRPRGSYTTARARSRRTCPGSWTARGLTPGRQLRGYRLVKTDLTDRLQQ
jgi:hypothetical protein